MGFDFKKRSVYSVSIKRFFMLSQKQQQFIFKRALFQKISSYLSWSIGVSGLLAWGLMYWLKPEMVDPQTVLDLLKEKKQSGLDLTPLTDISVLAVTGATAVSVVFVMIIIIAFIMNAANKREKQYLDIIKNLQSG